MTVIPNLSLPKHRQAGSPRFALGQLLITPGAMDWLAQHHVSAFDLLARHVAGDWGDVCAEDAQANEAALRYGTRLLSVYVVAGQTCYAITEKTRESTTVLLSSEY